MYKVFIILECSLIAPPRQHCCDADVDLIFDCDGKRWKLNHRQAWTLPVNFGLNRSIKPHEIRDVNMSAATLPVVEAILQHFSGHFYIEFRNPATLTVTQHFRVFAAAVSWSIFDLAHDALENIFDQLEDAASTTNEDINCVLHDVIEICHGEENDEGTNE
jgi:hypothetical protein